MRAHAHTRTRAGSGRGSARDTPLPPAGRRARYSQTASYLATASNITDLVDSHIFKDAKKVGPGAWGAKRLRGARHAHAHVHS